MYSRERKSVTLIYSENTFTNILTVDYIEGKYLLTFSSEFFLGNKVARMFLLTTHIYLALNLRMCGTSTIPYVFME